MSTPFKVLCLAPIPPDYLASLSEPDLRFFHGSSWEEFKSFLIRGPVDLILSSFNLPGLDIPSVQALLKEEHRDVPLLAVLEQVNEALVINMMQAGAADCVASSSLHHLKLAFSREMNHVRSLRKLQLKRRDAVRSVSSRLAHDFNNILAPVTMSAPMLKWDLEDADFEDIVDTLEQTARLGADTIHNLLIYGRGTELHRQETALEPFLSGLLAEFRQTLPSNIGLEIELQKDLPPLYADEEKLKPVLISFLHNAVEAMPHGGSIGIKAEKEEDGLGTVLTISDHGEGMDPATLEQVFDPFFSTKRQSRKGAGLGLSLALGIVKSHGGDITVESRAGRESHFRIYLPPKP